MKPATAMPKWLTWGIVLTMALAGAVLGTWARPFLEKSIPKTPDINWILNLNIVLGAIGMAALVVGGWLLARAIDRRKK